MWCALSKALDAEAKRVEAMSKEDQVKETLILARQDLDKAEVRVEKLEEMYWSLIDALPETLKQQWIKGGLIKFES